MHVEIWSDIACPWCYARQMERQMTEVAAGLRADEVRELLADARRGLAAGP